MEGVNNQNISVKIGDDKNYTLFKITKIQCPENHFQLVMGKFVEGESFGNGFETYLDAEQLEALERLLRFGKEL